MHRVTLVSILIVAFLFVIVSLLPGGEALGVPIVVKEKAVLNAQTRHIYSLAISPDSRLLAVGEADGAFSLWDLRLGRYHLGRLHHRTAVQKIAFSQDGKTLVTASMDGSTGKVFCTLAFWETKSLAFQRQLTVEGQLHAVHPESLAATVPCEKKEKTFVDSDAILLYSLNKGEKLATLDGLQRIAYVAISPDARQVAALDREGWINIWDVPLKKEPRSIFSGKGSHSIGFSPDGRTLGVLSGLFFRLHSLGHSKDRPGNPSVNQPFFSPDGEYLTYPAGLITLYSAKTAKKLFALKASEPKWQISPGAFGNVVAISVDGRHVYAGGTHGEIHIWEIPHGR